MENRNNKPILDDEQRKEQHKRMFRSWAILLGVIALAVLLTVLISFLGSGGHSITAVSLPCYTHQDVTPFQDGVLYYDGASIHFVNATGSIEWSHPVGSGASFSVSDTHLIVWSGSQLAIVDAKGRSSYNRAMDDTIIFARIGRKHAAIITGDELTSTLYVKDLQGTQIDFETSLLDGQVMLDCGFYGSSDEYLWTLSYDFYAPVVTSILQTFQVGQTNMGIATLTNFLPSKVIYVNDRLNVFTTQQLFSYDYRGVEDTSAKMLVYGWRYLDHTVTRRGTANILLGPTTQGGLGSLNELRLLSNGLDRRYTLPTACVGAAVQEDHIYAFSSQYMYSGKTDSQQFYTHQIPLPDGRHVTAFIGLTSNGYAIVESNNEVYSVSLPR